MGQDPSEFDYYLSLEKAQGSDLVQNGAHLTVQHHRHGLKDPIEGNQEACLYYFIRPYNVTGTHYTEKLHVASCVDCSNTKRSHLTHKI